MLRGGCSGCDGVAVRAMSIQALEKIKRLHAAYCALTGMQVALDMVREGTWFEFCRKGFTEDDLRAVVRSIRAGIADGKRNPGALKFSNLVGQLDFFEEDLAMVRAQDRGRKSAVGGQKAEVLRAT